MINKNEQSIIEKAREQGIHLTNYSQGDYRVKCPECSQSRRKKHENCLSVTVASDSILWMCHHCDVIGLEGLKKVLASNVPTLQLP